MVRYTADILYDSDTDDEQLPVAKAIPEPEKVDAPNPCEEGPLISLYRCRRCEGIDGPISYSPIQVGVCADRQCYDRVSLVDWAQRQRNRGQEPNLPHSPLRVYNEADLPTAVDPNGVACGGPPAPVRRRRQCQNCTIMGERGKKDAEKKPSGAEKKPSGGETETAEKPKEDDK